MKELFIFLSIVVGVVYGSVKQPDKIQTLDQVQETKTEVVDNRVEKLALFFKRYSSPLATVSAHFVKVADEYGYDWRLLPAIAGAESSFETRGNTFDHNPFGILCTHTSPCAAFDSFEEAIEMLAAILANHRAYALFRQTKRVEDIAKYYLTGNKNQWVKNVNFFMDDLGEIL